MSITITIDGDAKGFEKAAEQVKEIFGGLNKDVEKFSNEGGGAMASFKGNLAAIGVEKVLGLIKDGFVSAVDSIKEFSAAGRESQVATNAFNLALANTGKFSEKTSESFQKFAEGLQKSTNISDEAILTNAALIQSYGKLDSEGLQRATQAAADLSAAIGVDFGTASNILAKASTGNVEALKKYGLQVEDTGNKTKDFESALKQIEQRFGGSAQSAIVDFDKASKMAGMSFGDIQENIGLAINKTPALVGVMRGAADIFDVLAEMVKSNDKAIQDFITGGIQLFIDGIGYAGTGAQIFLDVLTGGNVILTSVQNIISAVAEGYFQLADTILAAGQGIAEFTGLSTDGITKAREVMNNLITTTQEYSAQNNAELDEYILNNDKRKESIQSFTDMAKQKLQERVNAQIEAGVQENNAMLEQQNQRALNNQMATDSEIAYKQMANDQYFEYLRANLGKDEAAEVQHQLKKLANEGKYQEALRTAQKAQIAARKNDIFAYEKFEDLTNKQRIENMKTTFSTISSLQSTSTGALFEVGKASAIAMATIDGIAAVQKALSSAPPPFNFALAALVGVATGANIAKIASQKPPKATGASNGAFVTSGSSGSVDTEPFMLAKGELVAPARSFDEVVEGTARSRGFVQGDENAGILAKLEELKQVILLSAGMNINAGVLVADDNGINMLIEKVRDQILYKNADIGVG